MYTLKSIAQRSTMLGAAAALLVAAVLPASQAFADALNPLTERSLLLSSSAPGFQDTDGSNNSETSLNSNGETFAPPGSGPNGKKTGQTFSFNVSSDSTSRNIEGITFQYCTTAAGVCQSPGNNTGDARDDDPTPRQANDGVGGGWASGTSDLNVEGAFAEGAGNGQFQVFVDNVAQTGWVMDAINREDTAHSGNLSGKDNYMRLVKTGGGAPAAPTPGQNVRIVFRASTSTYITNPGQGSFFVKINTYDSNDTADLLPSNNANVIDGGVTVANVMTDSIHITTKVLETMAFSVGTRNPDTVVRGQATDHATCETIEQLQNNRLNLGDPDAEYSLQTTKGWDVASYWRLSSNSSGGATVYYSGNTLANTVGDEIADMQSETASLPGTEQFGLGFVDAGTNTGQDQLSTSFNAALALPNTRYKVPSSYPFRTLSTQTTGDFDLANLPAQPTSADYDEATGTLDNGAGAAGTAKFKFKKSSLTVPEPIAQQNDQVISCATAKMRYVGNIGADTPAGVYTTKINYLAAPQY